MNRLIVFAAAVAAGYYVYSQNATNGAYADDGTPRTLFFSTAQCGNPCNDMRRYLKSRVTFEEFDAFDGGSGQALYREYGGSGFLPYVVMGEQRVTGPDRGGLISSIAAEFGLDEVRNREKKALQRNFDQKGDPLVVMYATDWCGYCEQARKYFAANGIAYVDLDIERDPSAKRDYDALLGTGTPLLYHGFKRMPGFNEAEIASRLDL